MKNKIVYIILAIAAIIGGVFYYIKKKKVVPTLAGSIQANKNMSVVSNQVQTRKAAQD